MKEDEVVEGEQNKKKTERNSEVVVSPTTLNYS